jgi:cell wall-associated NlpC family hydrolase
MRSEAASPATDSFLHYPAMRTKLALVSVSLCLLAACAAPGPSSPPRTTYELPADVARDGSDVRSELGMHALAQLGVAYANGGSAPEEGFDCSGLVSYVYRRATGLRLPRTTYALEKVGRIVEPAELQPGDLVFFNTLSRAYSHVGIYMGEERFIHAPSSGGVVRMESMRADYWAQRFNGARRLLPS